MLKRSLFMSHMLMAALVCTSLLFGSQKALAQGSADSATESTAIQNADPADLLRSAEFFFGFDVDATAQTLADQIAKRPSDILVAELFKRRGVVFSQTSNFDLFFNTMKTVTKGFTTYDAFGEELDSYLWPIIGELQSRSMLEELSVAKKLSLGLQHWKTLGPFGRSNEGDFFSDLLQPEYNCNMNAEFRGAYGTIRWTEEDSEDPWNDRVAPPTTDNPRGNGWYYFNEFVVDKAQEARLELSNTGNGIKVWLNNALVFQRSPGEYRLQPVFHVSLVEGVNHLLIKVGTSASLKVRLLDLQGMRLAVSQPSEAQRTTVLQPMITSDKTETPTLDVLSARIQNRNKVPSRYSAIVDNYVWALVYQSHGRLEESVDFWYQATDGAVENSGLELSAMKAIYFEGNSLFPRAMRRNQLRLALESLATRDDLEKFTPNHFGAVMQLALLNGSEGREAAAAEMIESLFKQSAPWFARLAFAEFFSSKGWDAEERNQRLLAYELTKNRPVFLTLDRVRLAENDGQRQLAEKLLRDILAQRPGHGMALSALKSMLIHQSRFAEALDIHHQQIQLAGFNSYSAKSEMADIELAQGNWQESISIQRKLAAEAKTSRGRANICKSASELALRHGDRELALELLNLALDAEPGFPDALTLYRQVSGETPRLAHPLWQNVDHSILDTIKADDFPQASAAYLLDEEVWEVQRNGSFQSWEQRVLKILRQAGVDRFGRQSVSGEVLSVRTMLADGGEAEPATVVGTNFEFPNVATGNALHWTTRDMNRANDEKSLAGYSFDFAESDIAIPTALSRLTVIAPSTMALSWTGRNFADVVYTKTLLEDGRTQHRWELRKPLSRLREPNMPSSIEWMPRLTFDSPTIDRHRAERRRVSESFVEYGDTWIMRETLNNIVNETDRVPAKGIENAVKVYEWVNANIPTSNGNRHPHLTILEKSGDRETLFVELCRMAQVPLERIQVSTLREEIASPLALETRTYRETLWSVQGRFFSLEYRQAPVDRIPFNLVGKPFLTSSGVLGSSRTDAPRDNVEQSTQMTFRVTPELGAKVEGTITIFNEDGWEEKEGARVTSQAQRERELTQEVSSTLPGIVLESSDFGNLESVGKPWKRDFDGSLGKESMFPQGEHFRPHLPKVSEMLLSLVNLEERQFDLLFGADLSREVELFYEFPSGTTIQEVPANMTLESPAFVVSIAYKPLGATALSVRMKYQLRPTRIPASQYPEFKEQVQSLSKAEDRKIRLIFDKK